MKYVALVSLIALLFLTACNSRNKNGTESDAASDGSSGKTAVSKTVYVPGTWLTNYDLSLSFARKLNRPVLLDFTGSDWCGWCIRLDEEVFSQRAFIDYAKSDLILCKIDFPRKKQLPKAQQIANDALAEKYKVEGFPSIILVDASGKVINATGYQEGGAEVYVGHLRGLLRK